MSIFTCKNPPNDRAEQAKQFVNAALIRAIQIERDHAERWHELEPYAPRNRATEPAAPEWYEPNPWKSPVQDQPNLVTLNQWATVTRKIEAARIRRKKRATTAKPTAA